MSKVSPVPITGSGEQLVWGHLTEFRRNALALLLRCGREGKLVHLRLLHLHVYLLNDPPAMEALLTSHNRYCSKPWTIKLTKPFLGEGIIPADGESWLQQRRTLQPAFLQKHIPAYSETIEHQTEAFLAVWQNLADGAELDIDLEMKKLTMAIICQLLFSVDIRQKVHEIDDALSTVFTEFALRLSQPFSLPLQIPLPANRRYLGAIKRCDKLVYDFIKEHRLALESYDDLLSMLLATEAEGTASNSNNTSLRFDDQLLRDEMMNLWLAGYETTASALASSFYLLDKAPQVEAKLVEELDKVLEGRPPNIADLKKMPYLENVVKEVLRLCPPGGLLGRRVIQAFDLGGYHFEPGAEIWLSPYSVHRDQAYYTQPEEFIPERWAGGELERNLPKGAYIPFSAGPHQCLGNHFALAEIKLLLASIVQSYKLRTVPQPKRPVEFDFFLAIRFKYGLPMYVSKR
jgi:cytochrome P450